MKVRYLAWIGAGVIGILMIIEALMLLPAAPVREAEPLELLEPIRALENRAGKLEEAYDRLEEEFRRYIRRAPGPTPALAVETLIKDLDRLRDEVAGLQETIGRDPERAVAITSMRSEIRRLGDRVEQLARDRDHWNSVFWRRTRRLNYLLLAKGILLLVFLGILARDPSPTGSRTA